MQIEYKLNASARRLLPAAMPQRWLHVCHVKIMFALLRTNWFVSTKTNAMQCLVNWILLRIRVRSRNTQPCLNINSEPILENMCPAMSYSIKTISLFHKKRFCSSKQSRGHLECGASSSENWNVLQCSRLVPLLNDIQSKHCFFLCQKK